MIVIYTYIIKKIKIQNDVNFMNYNTEIYLKNNTFFQIYSSLTIYFLFF